VFLLVKNSDLRDQKIESLGLFDVLKTEIVCAGDLAPLQPFFMRCNNSAGQSNALWFSHTINIHTIVKIQYTHSNGKIWNSKLKHIKLPENNKIQYINTCSWEKKSSEKYEKN